MSLSQSTYHAFGSCLNFAELHLFHEQFLIFNFDGIRHLKVLAPLLFYLLVSGVRKLCVH
jgi:hypothetical protein